MDNIIIFTVISKKIFIAYEILCISIDNPLINICINCAIYGMASLKRHLINFIIANRNGFIAWQTLAYIGRHTLAIAGAAVHAMWLAFVLLYSIGLGQFDVA